MAIDAIRTVFFGLKGFPRIFGLCLRMSEFIRLVPRLIFALCVNVGFNVGVNVGFNVGVNVGVNVGFNVGVNVRGPNSM